MKEQHAISGLKRVTEKSIFAEVVQSVEYNCISIAPLCSCHYSHSGHTNVDAQIMNVRKELLQTQKEIRNSTVVYLEEEEAAAAVYSDAETCSSY